MEIKTNSEGHDFVLIDNKWRPFKEGSAYNSADNSWYPVGDPRNPIVEESKGGYASQMVNNIPRSAAKLSLDMLQPIMHPIDTVEGLSNLVKGGTSKLMDLGWDEEQAWNAAADYYGNRYGGVGEIADSIREDPVGVLSDVSMLGGVGLAKLPGKLGKIGKVMGAADPALAISNTAIKGGSVAAKYLNNKLMLGMEPSALMEGALKLSTTTPIAERKAMVNTVLNEQLMPTAKGNRQIQSRLDAGNLQVKNLIDNIPETEITTRGDLSSTLPNVIDKYASNSLDDMGNKAAIDAVGNKFNTTRNMFDDAGELIPDSLPPNMPPRDVQDFKKKAYNSINFDAKRQKDSVEAAVAAQKELARNARVRVEELTPEIADVNRQLGELYELQEPFQRAYNRIANRDTMGIGIPLKVAAGEAAMPGGGVVGGLLGVLDTPKIKARAALKGHELSGRNLTQQLMDTNSSGGYMAREVLNLIQDQREKGLLGN